MPRYATLVLCAAALLTATASALAGGPPETIVLPPRTFAAVNPCSGEPHLVTIAETVRSHEFELTDPARLHINDRLTGTITTNDGFTGTIAEVGTDNGAWEEGNGEFGAVINGIARNDSGDAFSVHSVLHVTLVGDEPTADIDYFRLECLG
jgi:hypothetical protein